MYVFRHIIEPSFLVDILLFFAVGSIRMFLVILSLMLHSHILHLSFRFLDRSIFQSFSGSFSGWFVCLFGSLCSRLGGICLFLMLQYLNLHLNIFHRVNDRIHEDKCLANHNSGLYCIVLLYLLHHGQYQ